MGRGCCTTCDDDNKKIFGFYVSLWSKEDEIDTGLKVNFEFYTDGLVYVTKKKSEMAHVPGGGYAIMHYEYKNGPFTVVLKQFAIVCPRNQFNVLAGDDVWICPFEGQTPAYINIQTQQQVDYSSQPGVPDDTQTIWTSNMEPDSFPQLLWYRITRHTAIDAHVTLRKAISNNCSSTGTVKAVCQSDFTQWLVLKTSNTNQDNCLCSKMMRRKSHTENTIAVACTWNRCIIMTEIDRWRQAHTYNVLSCPLTRIMSTSSWR